MPSSQVNDYAALHARIRARLSRQLTFETWQELYAASDCVLMCDVLRNGPYGSYLQKVEAEDRTPRRAVFELKKVLTDAYQSIIPISPVELQLVLSEWLRVYEVDNLKATIRGIIIGETWDRVRHTLFPLGQFSKLSYEKMMGSNSLTDAIELLKGSIYYSPLTNALVRYTQEKNIFVLEVALDLDYWSRLWKDVQKLPLSDRTHARQLIGTLLDMNNLLWALRYRVYHQLSEEEIINYTLPFGYQVHDKHIRMLAAGGDISHILSDIYPDFSESNTGLKNPEKYLPVLEHWLMKRSIKKCKQNFIGYPFHAGIPIAYLHMLAMEIQDLTVLIEAKSMEIPFNRYRKFLLFDHSSLVPTKQQ